MSRLSAEEYRHRYGATTGDRVRLGDTDLWVRVAEDRTALGDEPVWGYAKNLRSGIEQDDHVAGPSELDILLTGALVIDPVLGVIKADIGIKDGRIAGIGRSGSPDIVGGIDLLSGCARRADVSFCALVLGTSAALAGAHGLARGAIPDRNRDSSGRHYRAALLHRPRHGGGYRGNRDRRRRCDTLSGRHAWRHG